MNNRERIINTLLGKPTDRAPLFFKLGFWDETLQRWKAEGIVPGHWDDGLPFDAGIWSICDPDFPETTVNLGLCPWFDEKILEEDDRRIVKTDRFGATVETLKGSDTLGKYLSFPVQDMQSWNKIKERLNPDDPRRFPADFDRLADEMNQSERLIVVGEYPYGVFGTCREFMGLPEFMVSFYTQPELIHDMMDYLTDFWIAIYRKIAKKVRIDCIHMWEDMSGNTGPLISPDFVREFMLPNYKKVKAFCDEMEIPLFSVDTDGDIRTLIEPFMESGVNWIYPFEVIPGITTMDYRRAFPEIGIYGGIDKLQIAKGPEAIEQLMVEVRELLRKGRFIPAPDHAIPPMVSHENYCYFVKCLRATIEEVAMERKMHA